MAHSYNIEDISYTITEYCPGPCRYCSIWQLKDRRDEELTSAELDSIFSSKHMNLKKVHLTGGESHMTDTYFRVVDSLYKYHKDIVIDTPITGWFPERHVEISKYVLNKAPLYRLDVSLDGDEEVNGRIRLRKDGYKLAIKTIEELKKLKGAVIRIQFTIYKENHHQIEWIYNLAKELGIGLYLGYGRFNPERYRNCQDNLNKEELNYDSFVWTQEELDSIDRQLRNIGYDKSRYAAKYKFQKAIYDKQPIEFDCYMGTRSIDIDPYGEIYPCLMLRDYLRMGNIRQDGGFDKVLESKKALEVHKKIREKYCQKDCTFTCGTKIKLINPDINSVGMINYGGGKYSHIFSDIDVIPIRPWWYDEYKEKHII